MVYIPVDDYGLSSKENCSFDLLVSSLFQSQLFILGLGVEPACEVICV